jgi:MFS transporter, Spinster family, sphingosine-1-phosphate transporter
MKNETPIWKSAGFGALLLLTFVNLFNYLDRYILVALSPSIKKEFDLTYTQTGFLVTVFMYSYFVIAPVFGWLGDRKPRYQLMALGVGIWSLATVGSGLARTYASLLGSRVAVGVGEAAYGAISPSLITDLFPKTLRGRVFAVFFMAIPVGSALGYLLGGALEKWVGWRYAFVLAGAPGVLLALALLFLREPKRGAQDEVEVGKVSLKEAAVSLAGNSNYFLTVLGYCAYTFVLGGVAFFIPHYIVAYLGVDAATGNIAFGGITVAAGIAGTFVGGYWADRWARSGTDAYLKLSALSMFAALPVYMLSLQTSSFVVFCVWVFFLEFLLFLSTSPINAQIVNAVSPSLRATANAMGIFFIHLLGDGISPPLIGYVAELTSLHTGMQLFSIAILLSGLIWAWKAIAYWECLPWPSGALALPKAQCHRGFHSTVQENTIAAFRAAAKSGARMVELDVRLSADGIPVVVHDEDTLRVAGVRLVVGEASAEQLKREAAVPSLRDVLEDLGCATLSVNVEIKSDQARGKGLEEAVAAVVKATRSEGRVLFSSFNPLALRRLAKLLPGVPRALLATGEANQKNKFYLRRMWLAFLARPHMLNYDGRFLTPALAASLRSRGVPFAVWTIEDRAEARKYLAMGAGSIISPLPDIL